MRFVLLSRSSVIPKAMWVNHLSILASITLFYPSIRPRKDRAVVGAPVPNSEVSFTLLIAKREIVFTRSPPCATSLLALRKRDLRQPQPNTRLTHPVSIGLIPAGAPVRLESGGLPLPSHHIVTLNGLHVTCCVNH